MNKYMLAYSAKNVVNSVLKCNSQYNNLIDAK
jgi:hypothetical protein